MSNPSTYGFGTPLNLNHRWGEQGAVLYGLWTTGNVSAPSAVGARMAGACPDGLVGTHNLAAVVEWHIHEIRDSIQSVHVFHESSS